MRIVIALCATLCVALSQPAAGAARSAPCAIPVQENQLVADATQPGVVGLHFYNADGARVTFYECVRGHAERLGSRRVAPNPALNRPTRLDDAVTWSCDRLVRRFAATATLPDGGLAAGAYAVRTPSCAQRFELRVRRRVAAGAVARVTVTDRWRLGAIRTQLCVTPPRARRDCRALAFPRAVSTATRRFRAGERGRWRVELRVRDHRVRAVVAVGDASAAAASAPPTVLATGDSTMQGIDSFLSDELGEAATVRSDVRLGSQISNGEYWKHHARSQVKRLRPSVTVISVGAASDGYPLPTPAGALVSCCDQPWVLAYGARVRAMMRTYLRGGRGHVFWLTPPRARYAPRARITTAVAAAAARAAAGLPNVTVVRIDEFFSPGGYRDVIRYRGRNVRVRDADGVHLSIAGTAIAAGLLAPAIRAALGRAAAS